MIRCKPLLGTYVEICAVTDCVIDEAFTAVELVQALMGFHNPESELSQINARAHLKKIPVHEWTFQVLQTAQELYDSTQGIFDCGVGKQLIEAGLLPRHANSTHPVCGSIRDLIFTKPNMISSKNPVTLDLGGIAKGFAVDKAIEVLQQNGVESGYVNAGGDLRVFGNTSQEILVRNPTKPSELIAIGTLENGSIASSGLYYCHPAKAKQGHIVDPKTMQQIPFTASYSVIAPECIYADALTKVLAISKNTAHPCFQKYSAEAVEISL